MIYFSTSGALRAATTIMLAIYRAGASINPLLLTYVEVRKNIEIFLNRTEHALKAVTRNRSLSLFDAMFSERASSAYSPRHSGIRYSIVLL